MVDILPGQVQFALEHQELLATNEDDDMIQNACGLFLMHSTSDDSAQNQTKLLSIAETDPHTAQIGFSRREQRWTRLSKSEDEKSARFL